MIQASGYKEDDDGEGSETGGMIVNPNVGCNRITFNTILGSTFGDVDLSEKEWADYDEKSGESTVISEMEFKFIPVK